MPALFWSRKELILSVAFGRKRPQSSAKILVKLEPPRGFERLSLLIAKMRWRSIAFDEAGHLPKKKTGDAKDKKRQPGALQYLAQFLRRNAAKTEGYEKQGFQ